MIICIESARGPVLTFGRELVAYYGSMRGKQRSGSAERQIKEHDGELIYDNNLTVTVAHIAMFWIAKFSCCDFSLNQGTPRIGMLCTNLHKRKTSVCERHACIRERKK